MAGEAAQRLLELALLGAVTRREPAVLVCQSPAAAAAAWRGTGARFAAAGLAVARLEAADRSGRAVWPEAQPRRCKSDRCQSDGTVVLI